MILLDVFLLSGLFIATALGYRAGLRRKVFNLVLALTTIIAIAQFAQPIGEWFFDEFVLSDQQGYAIAMFIILGATIIPGILLYRKFESIGHSSESSHFFGGLFGLFEGALIISICMILFRAYGTPDQESRDESILYGPLAGLAQSTFVTLEPLVPGGKELRLELARVFDESSLKVRARTVKENL